MNIRAACYDDWPFFAKKVAWYGRKDKRIIHLGATGERSEDR